MAVLLTSSPALAERFSSFRVVGAPQASAKGLAVKLCFDAEWPKDSAEANKGVEFAVYDRVPGPGAIRATQRKCFTVKDVPTSGTLDLTIPFEALEATKAKPGSQVYLTGHWRNAQKGGVTATHVHGFDSRKVPIALPSDLVLPATKAQQNSALRRTLRLTWRPASWRPRTRARGPRAWRSPSRAAR